ncbi:MAG: SxtJ family membrane protein [Gammaproteobacteria bacterium]|jgi:hypothetical protein|nr:SxtJ family membrane protein [Gammaproteobacteria bacterium]MDP6617602.1 SxtJ family membrane protein [Gammaproteobacteria bacterium]MDP6694479.1 SxtJ family membrane protein [Gammaproteobacteria bacterium]
MTPDEKHPIPELDRKGYRDFALITSAIVVVLFGILIPYFFFEPESLADYPRWPWILLVILGGWGLVAPMTLKYVYKGWMMFGLFMGTYIMTPLIMFIVFFAIFMPMGLIMRLFGKDLLAVQLDDGTESYRVPSARPPVKNLEKPF